MAALAICCSWFGACASEGGQTAGTGEEPEDSVTSGDVFVVPEPGPPMLPPLDSPALDGMAVQMVRTPDDITPEQVDRYRGYSPGLLTLYGDPSVEDPLARPWALAIQYQGSENSELGAFSSDDPSLSYIDVPVEQTSQETLAAGVLSSGLGDGAQDLANALVLAVGDPVTGEWSDSVTIDAAALDTVPERLELITSAPFDVGALNAASDDTHITPQVDWVVPGVTPGVNPDDASGYRRLSVASFAADPGLELLLRATMGGATVGRQVLAVTWAGGEVASAVRTVGDTTVLVQSLSVPHDALAQLVDSLRPATVEDWTALRGSFDHDQPRFMPEAEGYLAGDVPGGRWEIALDLGTGTAEWGTYHTCNVGYSVTFADGGFGGGGESGGQCAARGIVQAQTISETDLTLLGGYLSTSLSRVVLTLDDGSVVEPELIGAGVEWCLFGVVVPGHRTIATAEVFDADGVRVADLVNPDPAETQEQLERLSDYFESEAGG